MRPAVYTKRQRTGSTVHTQRVRRLKVCRKHYRRLTLVSMREHSILKTRELLEARKMKKTKKLNVPGLSGRLVSNIFKRAKAMNLEPGYYDAHGAQLHVKTTGDVLLVCPQCLREFDSYLDYSKHQTAE